MEDIDPSGEHRRAQATQWFARLRTVPVSKGTLDAFFEWRRNPANAEAFAEVETLWGDAARVGARPAMLRLADEAMARRGGRAWRWPLVPSLVLGTVLLVAVLAGSWRLFDRTPDIDIATRVGERRSLALADGSLVEINTNTRLDARLDAQARRIRIDEGEALFEVAHDRARPFLVTAGDVEVRATGTRFDVRHIDGRTLVTLFEGGVDIRAAGRPAVRLRPGERWQSDASSSDPIVKVDARAAIAWTQGRILFEATPLQQAVDEINRYTAQKIVLTAREKASAPISGSFTAGDPSAFVKAVSAMLELRIDHRADGGFTLREGNPSTR